MDDGPVLGTDLQSGDIQEIVGDALKHFSIYHARPAAVRRGDRVFHEDRNLLLFYGNRLRGYDLGRALNDAPDVGASETTSSQAPSPAAARGAMRA